jgi:hypothetical protein
VPLESVSPRWNLLIAKVVLPVPSAGKAPGVGLGGTASRPASLPPVEPELELDAVDPEDEVELEAVRPEAELELEAVNPEEELELEAVGPEEVVAPDPVAPELGVDAPDAELDVDPGMELLDALVIAPELAAALCEVPVALDDEALALMVLAPGAAPWQPGATANTHATPNPNLSRSMRLPPTPPRRAQCT